MLGLEPTGERDGAAGRLLHRLPRVRAPPGRADHRGGACRCRLAELTAFHKIAKRRLRRHLVAWPSASRSTSRDGVVAQARIGLGGVAATPIRALATEAALEGRPWTPGDRRRRPPTVLGRRGHADRRPAGQRAASARRCSGQSLRKLYAESARGGDPSTSDGRSMSQPLSERPDDAVVGETMPHESAALHVTGHGALHRRPRRPHQRRAARPPRAGAARPRPGHPARRRAGVRRAGRGPRADRRRRARRQRRRRQARRAAVPRRGHVLRPRGLLGARRDASRPRGAGRRRSRWTTSRCRRC